MHTQIFDSIDRVPSSEWNRIVGDRRIGLQAEHLRAIEKAKINRLVPRYLVFSNGGGPEAVGTFSRFEIDFSRMDRDLKPGVRDTLKQWHPGFLRLSVVECGLVSGLGEGIASVGGHAGPYLVPFAEASESFARENGADFILFRDVPYSAAGEYGERLGPLGYRPVMGFPGAGMDLRWPTFEAYLESLKSNAHREARRHLEKLADPELTVERIDRFGDQAEELFSLWSAVHDKVDTYSHEELNAEYFRRIDADLGDRSFVIAVRHLGRLAAFALCLDGDDELISLYVGIDYKVNPAFDLYFNLHFLALEEAIRRGRKRIHFGITSYEFKMLIGCELEPLVYFVKHAAMPDCTVSMAHFIGKAIEQPQNPHRPFRNQDAADRAQLPDLAAALEGPGEAASRDVFHKTRTYHRHTDVRLSGLYAFFPEFQSAQEKTVMYRDRTVIMLGSNSYMGLGSHPEVREAAKEAIDRYGTGCSGSPFLNGTLDLHERLRRSLAEFMGKEDALLFSTGYQTNLGVVSALGGRHDVLVLDSLDHASLVDAARLSFADIVRFRHNDMESLETVLRRFPDRGKLIVVDSVFSMEGAIADLPSIVKLAKQYGARLMLDEAHGIGVLGPNGRGAAEAFGLLDDVDIVMGTFSKSFAAVGGFVAADAGVIAYLRHTARSHMFSASLPPAVAATALKAIEIFRREPERRTQVLENARFMADGLSRLGYEIQYRGTAIVPVYCRDEMLALGLFKKLFDEGVYVNPVLSPAVPKGDELLRTSYMAVHDRETLERALGIFAAVRTPAFPSACSETESRDPVRRVPMVVSRACPEPA
jgi:8-amino-7-oxononanoate synthase